MKESVQRPARHPGLACDSLSAGGQLFVWGARQWVVSSRGRRCITRDLLPRYQSHGCEEGVGFLDEMMSVLSLAACRPVEIRCPCTVHLGADETLLLTSLRAMQRGDEAGATLQLNHVIRGRLNRSFRRAAEDFVAALGRAGESLAGASYLQTVTNVGTSP